MFDKIIARFDRLIPPFRKTANTQGVSQDLQPVETTNGFCLVCGRDVTFLSYKPLDFPCKRNSFVCQHCQSNARNRHLAKVILKTFATNIVSLSLADFSSLTTIKIFNTSANGALHRFLSSIVGYEGSEFFEGVLSGDYVNNIQCQDIQKTSFPDNKFDLILTEDVLEHVPDPKKACDEIKRILKPGGWHLSTIPVLFQQEKSITRSILKDGTVQHVLPNEYHHVPYRPEGVLVFTDFGQDLVEVYLERIGATVVYESHNDQQDEENYAIYNNWVYASQKA